VTCAARREAVSFDRNVFRSELEEWAVPLLTHLLMCDTFPLGQLRIRRQQKRPDFIRLGEGVHPR
jgi:hypothetical protein